MVWFPNAKINLGLNVVEKRVDGFHNLESVIYPVKWKDILEIIENRDHSQNENKIIFSSSGLTMGGNQEVNLAVKGYRLLDNRFTLPPVKMHLHKIIPMGAGLGGGSSDAAFVLKGLNELFKIGIGAGELNELAMQVGSDCPFFIYNQPVIASGRGEIMEPVETDLSRYKLLIVWPGIHSSTAEAFGGIIPAQPKMPLKEIVNGNISSWKDLLVNDFEITLFKKYPVLKQIKDEFYGKGALYASLSGSGSSLYAIFEHDIPEFHFPHTYLTYSSE